MGNIVVNPSLYSRLLAFLVEVLAENVEAMEQMLDQGIDINSQIKGDNSWPNLAQIDTLCQRTPLLWACKYGKIRSALFLIKRGADVNSCERNDYGVTPICALSYMYCIPPVLEALLEAKAISPSYLFVKLFRLPTKFQSVAVECAKMLLQTGGCSANLVVGASRTPLIHLASICSNNNLAMMDVLHQHGVDVNQSDKEGHTALHILAAQSVTHTLLKRESIQFLIDRGANVHGTDVCGNTPLHLSIRSCMTEVLLENRADVNALNNNSETPLHLAAKRKSSGVMCSTLLIAHGACLTIQNKRGLTPLQVAEEASNFEQMMLLRRQEITESESSMLK